MYHNDVAVVVVFDDDDDEDDDNNNKPIWSTNNNTSSSTYFIAVLVCDIQHIDLIRLSTSARQIAYLNGRYVYAFNRLAHRIVPYDARVCPL